MNKLQCTETFGMTYNAFHVPEVRQLVSMGGSRSSKSYSILQMLMLEMFKTKNLKITCWRNQKNTCRTTILEDFKKIIMFDPKVYVKFKENKQSGTFTYLPTGARIIFEGADSIGKVLGGQQDISFFNEVTEFSYEVYLQITQRTAWKVICDYNPSKGFFLEDYRFDPRTRFIRTNFEHNCFCPKNIVIQLKSYEPWLPGSYEVIDSEVYYKGKVITKQNQPPPHPTNIKLKTANEFMWLVYGLGLGAEKPNKIYHGWTPISLEDFENLEYSSYFGIDFGTAKPTACVEVKYDGNGALYVCERLYKPLGEIADSLPTVLKNSVPRLVKGKHYLIADSAKDSYINILTDHGYLAIPAIKGSGSVEAGITILQSLTVYYVKSRGIEKEYSTYSWQVDKKGVAVDVPIKSDDHLMDALRYVTSFLYEFLQIKI
jgi:phage terminase large subunit